MWVDHHVWLSVNILFSYFDTFCLELLSTPMPSFLGLGAPWTPCPSHRIFQARAVYIYCHLTRVHSTAVVQAAPVGVPVVLGEGLGWGPCGCCRTTSQIQVTKVDTCVYTSGVLGSPHQRPEKETRPWARFLHTRGPPESAWDGGKGEVRTSLSVSLCLKELLHVKSIRTLSCPQNPSTTP